MMWLYLPFQKQQSYRRYVCEVWGPHEGENGDYFLLGDDAAAVGNIVPKYRAKFCFHVQES